MFKLNRGEYTGSIKSKLNLRRVLVHTIYYFPESELRGIHYHENPHLCLLLQGDDKESRKGISYARRCGELHFYHAGETHATVSRNQLTKSLVVEFENRFMEKNNLNELQIEATLKLKPDIKFQLLKLLHELDAHDNCSSLSAELLLLNIFTFTEHGTQKPFPKWVEIVNDLLQVRWNQVITLDELSLATGVHPITISKYFSKYYNCTLGEYLRRLRIERSIPLIKNTKMPLVEIGYQCGFADQSHFIRVFKNTTGFLPNEFRRL